MPSVICNVPVGAIAMSGVVGASGGTGDTTWCDSLSKSFPFIAVGHHMCTLRPPRDKYPPPQAR